MNKIEGLIAAPFVPLNGDGDVNYDQIPAYYDLLAGNGVVGAFINGSTGEGVSLTQKEKVEITAAWTSQNRQKKALQIISLVGGTSYADCIENARASAELGVDAIAILAPYYFKPDNAGQLAEFCAKIAETVPEVPVYFYHIPVLTGCHVPMLSFLQQAAKMIPNLAGIKYTHEDFMDFLSCVHFENSRYDMLWGRDENLLSALVLGARGGVGSTYNYAAPLYLKLIRAFDDGNLDEARKLQQLSIDMIRLLGKYGGIATGKAFMRYIGLECGEFRLPVKNMTEDAYMQFRMDVRKLNMEQLFSVH